MASSLSVSLNPWIFSTRLNPQQIQSATPALDCIPEIFRDVITVLIHMDKIQITYLFQKEYLENAVDEYGLILNKEAPRLAFLTFLIGLVLQRTLAELHPDWITVAQNLEEEYRQSAPFSLAKGVLSYVHPTQHQEICRNILVLVPLYDNLFSEILDDVSHYPERIDLRHPESFSQLPFWIQLFRQCLEKNPRLIPPNHWSWDLFLQVVLQIDASVRKEFEEIFQRCFLHFFQNNPSTCILMYLVLFSDNPAVFSIPWEELPQLTPEQFYTLFSHLNSSLKDPDLKENFNVDLSKLPWEKFVCFLVEFAAKHLFVNQESLKECLRFIPKVNPTKFCVILTSRHWVQTSLLSVWQTLLEIMDDSSAFKSLAHLVNHYQKTPCVVKHCPIHVQYCLDTLVKARKKPPVDSIAQLLKELRHQPPIYDAIHNTVVQSLSPEKIAAIDEALRMDPPLLPATLQPPAEGEEPPAKRPRTK